MVKLRTKSIGGFEIMSMSPHHYRYAIKNANELIEEAKELLDGRDRCPIIFFSDYKDLMYRLAQEEGKVRGDIDGLLKTSKKDIYGEIVTDLSICREELDNKLESIRSR